MPGIITHLSFARRYLKNNGQQNVIQEKGRFFAGSIFPDIRRLAQSERDQTHQRFEASLDFAGLNDFECGWKSHIFLDDAWNRLFDAAYPHHMDDVLFFIAAKIAEDSLEQKKIDNLAEITEYLRKPLAEKIIDIPPDKLSFYFSACADYALSADFSNFLKFVNSRDNIKNIDDKVQLIRQNKEMMDFLDGLMDKILP